MKTFTSAFRVLLLALLLLFCLVVAAPARLLAPILPPGQVLMQGYSGTLWEGKASRCLVKTPAGYLHLGAVGWRLDPWSLLRFAPRLVLDAQWGAQTLAAELVLRGVGDVDLGEVAVQFPADLLRQFVPVNLTGTFSLQIEQLLIRGGLPTAGSGRLLWQAGGWNSPSGPVPLGSYALDLNQPRGAPAEGVVLTLAGPVKADGRAQLQGNSYAIDIVLRSEHWDERLQQALSLVAGPTDEGYRIKLDGEF